MRIPPQPTTNPVINSLHLFHWVWLLQEVVTLSCKPQPLQKVWAVWLFVVVASEIQMPVFCTILLYIEEWPIFHKHNFSIIFQKNCGKHNFEHSVHVLNEPNQHRQLGLYTSEHLNWTFTSAYKPVIYIKHHGTLARTSISQCVLLHFWNAIAINFALTGTE